MKLTDEQVEELEKVAELNNGHCDRCGQTIKIYRYKLNRVHGQFMRAMADEVRNTGVNDVDIGTIGLAYSVRSQNSKLRQHGLIARVKNDKGAQIARRWLITHKGWKFLNGGSVPSKVIVFNNSVLGHDAPMVTIYEIFGEVSGWDKQIYEEVPVSEAESRVYSEVRKPHKMLNYRALFLGYGDSKLRRGDSYDIEIEKLAMGKPVIVNIKEAAKVLAYPDIAAFQKVWKVE